MNLLPKSHEEFSQTEYWNKFFKKLGNKAFEWYGEYSELCGLLHKYIKPKDNILVVGCGNSKLSSDMFDIGYRSIINIDISPIVIKSMIDANKTERSEMKFICMDATQMVFEDDSFSVILDKGTLDALMHDDSEETKKNVLKYLEEIHRVSKNLGRYICISLLQEHVLKVLLDYFPKNSWTFRIIRCFDVEKKTMETSSDSMPVFMIVATKMQNLPIKILEIDNGGNKIERMLTETDILHTIIQDQKAVMICNGLKKSSMSDNCEIPLNLYRPGETTPRYTIIIVDQKIIRPNGKFAAFIVPQGRETDWLFCTKEGRQKLLKSANFERLAIVTMHRGQTYPSWDSVKEELSESITNLSPKDLRQSIPYLSLGSDVGKREDIYLGKSEFSGDFLVEDVAGDNNKIFRRLIFLKNQFVIQSEALIKVAGSKKQVDYSYLACQHHLFIAIGANALEQKKSDVLVIGLGGGGLCTFINKFLPDINITAVELDPAMVDIATKYFGLKVSNKLKIVVDDGIKYLEESSKQLNKFSSIIFDVDNKESSLGISCPPVSFIEDNVLNWTKNCLTDSGLFILNLVARDEVLKKTLCSKLKNIFPSICSFKVEDELNEIVYCSPKNGMSRDCWRKILKQSAVTINHATRKYNKLSKETLIDTEVYIDKLIIQ